MKVHELKPAPGSRRLRRRVGRGIAAGQGKTCGRGSKGQKQREAVRPGFEGGQMPLYMRVPKQRGTSKSSRPWDPFRKEFAIVNVGALNRFAAETSVTPELLYETGLARRARHGVRILGQGELEKPLHVQAQHVSAGARAKIESAGGSVEVIAP
jgi:large subunit ribosomal protein L15